MTLPRDATIDSRFHRFLHVNTDSVGETIGLLMIKADTRKNLAGLPLNRTIDVDHSPHHVEHQHSGQVGRRRASHYPSVPRRC
jgi:hypothetical protein